MPITPGDVQNYTQGKIVSSDPRVQPLIDAAYRAIQRYCGWHIAPIVQEQQLLDGSGGSILQLRTMRVTEILSVTELGVVLPADHYEWSATGEIRRIRGGWPGVWTSRYRAVEVSFKHGFESAPDVDQIVLQVIAQALSSPMGATREQAGALSVSWATTAPGVSGGLSLLARDYAVLDSYKLPARV